MNAILKRSFVISFVFCVISFPAAFSQSKKSISAADELKSFYDISLLPAYRPQTISGQISSYDTTGGNNDGFDGLYSFIRRNKDSSLVIFDMKGPGVVNRIWTPSPTDDTLDFYIDNTVKPTLSICYTDLFSGKIYPFVQPLSGNQLGGYYCYYPILFQKSCRIVCRGKRLQFHQIGYRLFSTSTRVNSFTKQPDAEATAALQTIQQLWNIENKTAADFFGDNDKSYEIDTSVSLQPGQSATIANINVGGRFTGIELSPSVAFEGLYKDVDIRMFWDDETTPAIDCPVSDFFGFAFGKPSMRSLLLGSSKGKLYCYFPMPFYKKGKIELVYRKRADTVLSPVQIAAHISYTAIPQNPQTEGKFYAHWQQVKPAEGEPFVFASMKGKGHYIGTILQAQGIQVGMPVFFEGDDSTVIDGKMRLHGTGSEDHFNGGWYALKDRWDGAFSLPLSGALDFSLLFSRTGAYRFYMNDKLSFDKSFYHTIEHGGEHNAVPVLYTCVGFYYGDTPPDNPQLPKDDNTQVYIPDTLNIFPEFTKLSPGYNMTIETTWDSASTGQSYKMNVNDETLLIFYPDGIPAGRYQVYADVINQPEGCRFSVWQRQTQLSGWLDTKATTYEWIKNKPVGKINVTEGNGSLTIQINTDDTHHRFWLSKLMLVKMK